MDNRWYSNILRIKSGSNGISNWKINLSLSKCFKIFDFYSLLYRIVSARFVIYSRKNQYVFKKNDYYYSDIFTLRNCINIVRWIIFLNWYYFINWNFSCFMDGLYRQED